ncbi:hypothetical protein ATCC90586_009888 [Pythium insidiosum]|nr:hypothetical protein ATCC90586_009888 [Pythium insidiosum]
MAMWIAMWTLMATAAATAAALHTEELRLRPLPHSNKALAHFHFATVDDASLSPLALRQVLTKYDVASLRLSFSVGRYSDERFGPASERGGGPWRRDSLHAPFGARLDVELRGGSSPEERWKGVTSELGGIFSASLNQMDETTVVRPMSEAGAFKMSASLAREELCTENLTPWLKMLPCRAHEGLGALVDPIKVLSGDYLMLSIDASRDANTSALSLHQRLTTVQTLQSRQQRWSLADLFVDASGSSVVRACPLASSSQVVTETEAAEVHTVDLKRAQGGLSLTDAWPTHGADASPGRARPAVAVHRYLTGHGQVHGGIAVLLENRHPRCAMDLVYHDVTPWYLRLYFHTLETRLTSDSTGRVVQDASPPSVSFQPAELRGRPNQLQVAVRLPPQSTLTLSVQFDKAFVRLSEHPPDANRGFDVAPASAVFSPVTTDAACASAADLRLFTRELHSEPLLVALPTPDFSMPYNVITLSSTIIAFFVGTMLNTLLRKAPRFKRMLAEQPKAT